MLIKAASTLVIVAAYLFLTFSLSVAVGAFIHFGNACVTKAVRSQSRGRPRALFAFLAFFKK